jgi:hypothetical protein
MSTSAKLAEQVKLALILQNCQNSRRLRFGNYARATDKPPNVTQIILKFLFMRDTGASYPANFWQRNFGGRQPGAVPWLRGLVAGLEPRRPGFDPCSVYLGFVVDNVALGHVFLGVLRYSPVKFIPHVLHYLEKLKKLLIIFLLSSSQCCTISLKAVVRP